MAQLGVLNGPQRPSIGYTQQISHLKKHNITFHTMNENSAKNYLTYHTYLFKLKSFDNRFTKSEDAKYEELDFNTLRTLANIDYSIRHLAQLMTSDIEHQIKVRCNRILIETKLDAYQLVENFECDSRRRTSKEYNLRNELLKKRSAFNELLINKYLYELNQLPIWLVWEIGDFSTNIHLYKFVLSEAKYTDVCFPLFHSIRKLRNAAAHHNVLLANTQMLRSGENKPLSRMLHIVLARIPQKQRSKLIETVIQPDPLLSYLACTICAHLNMVPSMSTSQIHAQKQAKEVIGILTTALADMNEKAAPDLYAQLHAMLQLLSSFASFDSSIINSSSSQRKYLLKKPQPYKHSRNGRKRKNS